MDSMIKTGRTRTILLSISILLVSLHTIYFYQSNATELNVAKLVQQVIRFVLTAGLLYAIYIGKNWARILGIVLFGLGALGAIGGLIGLEVDSFVLKIPFMVMTFVYSMAIYHLAFSPSFKVFRSYQNRDKLEEEAFLAEFEKGLDEYMDNDIIQLWDRDLNSLFLTPLENRDHVNHQFKRRQALADGVKLEERDDIKYTPILERKIPVSDLIEFLDSKEFNYAGQVRIDDNFPEPYENSPLKAHHRGSLYVLFEEENGLIRDLSIQVKLITDVAEFNSIVDILLELEMRYGFILVDYFKGLIVGDSAKEHSDWLMYMFK